MTIPIAPNAALSADHAPNAIELEAASVVFGRGDGAVAALAPTTLDLPRGDFPALVGPSGRGKSTIVKRVGGLSPVSTGAAVVGGKEAKARALRIGMAFATN